MFFKTFLGQFRQQPRFRQKKAYFLIEMVCVLGLNRRLVLI